MGWVRLCRRSFWAKLLWVPSKMNTNKLNIIKVNLFSKQEIFGGNKRFVIRNINCFRFALVLSDKMSKHLYHGGKGVLVEV